ncbi:Fanconi anemia group M protein [Lampris incognitus]|uniref:Fanconi anemia group M protein n=1 Tax=Lampris incognitus TaxID=2546036 RepID=UPI0024B4953A|nr:Fanconi anemia group M protein [Lampris incognitus]
MSSGSNQRTLFQTWGVSVSENNVVQPKDTAKKAATGRRRAKPGSSASACGGDDPTLALPPHGSLWGEIGHGSVNTESTWVRMDGPASAVEEEDDDDLMIAAVYEAEKTLQLNVNSVQNNNASAAQSTSPSPVQTPGKCYPDFPGFDSSAATVWIYPTNYPIREYQLKISEAALYQNTLVCLPTGLGKTFIASVVMYNFYRWYPSGKIVFMAPTKPLVAQQIEACYKVMGIPQSHMAELTGSTAAGKRQDLWRSKRVFFLTPQVMVNDLSRDTCPALLVKCMVIDEAHKALGNHAYCQVVRQLSSLTQQFRILALSATPGGDTKSVQQVISNLLISHIELRSEESPDIQAHSHQRSLEKVVVPLGEALAEQQARYLQVLEKFTSRLVQSQVMGHKDLKTLTKYQLILAREQFRKNAPSQPKGLLPAMLEGDFALCISLCHGYELLLQNGLRSLFFYVQSIMDGSREMCRARNELQRTPIFMELYHEMEALFLKPSAGPDEPFIYSHPKLQKLEDVVLQHFKLWEERSSANNGPKHASASRPLEVSTRVMIFSSFRESVQEIAAMLNRHTPLIRVMTFMGQASARKGVKGFTQKEQLEVVHRFRQGGFNTLVSTCVGEEGLDIGEVDLIVCFDAQKSPIRLVQRMGRTGRKREGRIVVILAEGREERTYNQSQSNKRSVYKSIIGKKSSFHMYPNSPRMLPAELNPTLHKMHITCGQFAHQESSRRTIKGRRSHTEGLGSLIHPQNLVQQSSVKPDGFLSPTEYSQWESTMKLEENEVHPTLRQSHFMSLPNDQSPQEEVSKNGPPSRTLSLWEWRHWQNRALPTHFVDHSLRCYHFIKVMELIDGMREEDEGQCRYEQELRPHLHKADVDFTENRKLDKTINKKRQKDTKAWPKITKCKHKHSCPSLSDLDGVEEKGKMGLVMPLTVIKNQLSGEFYTKASCDGIRSHSGSETICPFPTSNQPPFDSTDHDCLTVSEEIDNPGIQSPGKDAVSDPGNLDCIFQIVAKSDENKPSPEEELETQDMFYLPKCNSAASSSTKFLPERQSTENLRVILANVAELLSRSPPPVPASMTAFDSDISLLDPIPATTTRPCESPEPVLEDRKCCQPFQVNFALDVDDDDDDDDDDDHLIIEDSDCASRCANSNEDALGVVDAKVYHDSSLLQLRQLPSASSPPVSEPPDNRDGSAANSPSWDDLFLDDSSNDNKNLRGEGIDEVVDDYIETDSLEEVGNGVAEKDSKVKNGNDDMGKREDSWDNVRNHEMHGNGVPDDDMDEQKNSQISYTHQPTQSPSPALQQCTSSMDDSIDLFGDDEAFIEMAIPNVPTREDSISPKTSPSAGHTTHSSKHTLNSSNTCTSMSKFSTACLTDSTDGVNTMHITHMMDNTSRIPSIRSTHTTEQYPERKQQNTVETNRVIQEKLSAPSSKCETDKCIAESFSYSADLFSVNFDLCYSPENSEDEAEEKTVPAPSMNTYPRPQQQGSSAASTVSLPAASGSSTPCHSVHRESTRPCMSRLSPPQALSEQGKSEMDPTLNLSLTSSYGARLPHITALDVRQTSMTGPSPSSIQPNLKSKQSEGLTTEAERGITARQKTLSKKRFHQEFVPVFSPPIHAGVCSSDSDDEVVAHKRRHQIKANPLSSPQMSDKTGGKASSDDDFQNDSIISRKTRASGPVRPREHGGKSKLGSWRGGRYFLDEEADLDENDEMEVSSDEEDGEEQNKSLQGFVVDNTVLSQGLNDSEMQGVYLKSVRSPAIGGKFKMSFRNCHNMDVFSQMPEVDDETYAEDSFVVGSDMEELENSEEEGEEMVIDLVPEDSYVDGRRQYATRRRALLHHIRAKAGPGSPTEQSGPHVKAGVKTKRSRIICIQDSSEEETEEAVKEKNRRTDGDIAIPLRAEVVNEDLTSSKPPQQQNALSSSSTIAAKVSSLSKGEKRLTNEGQQEERCRKRLQNQSLLSDQLDFTESESLLASWKQPQATPSTSSSVPLSQKAVGQTSSVNESPSPSGTPSGRVSILVDSRCISSGVEVVSSLRQRHAITVHVCSLDSSYFIVSNRMAVERHSQSNLAAMQNRKRLAERVISLQGLFERVCFIVEKDRIKPGDASRPFLGTRFYDSTVTALVCAGVRLLWSDGPVESAALLADLARLEHRKGQSITVPLEVKGQHRQGALQFCLTLPCVSYVHALNMIHNFRSMNQLINSSIEAIQKGGCVSRSRAEEIYHRLHYSCDMFLMNVATAKKNG